MDRFKILIPPAIVDLNQIFIRSIEISISWEVDRMMLPKLTYFKKQLILSFDVTLLSFAIK